MSDAKDASPYVEVRIGGLRRQVSDIDAILSHSGRLQFSADFPAEGIRRAQVDAELLASKLRENAEEMQMLLQAYMSGQGSEVQRLIGELGLSESEFQAQGGGIFWIVVIAGVLCCASEAY
jgi:hypothetical protein